jgi:hypothetical protein
MLHSFVLELTLTVCPYLESSGEWMIDTEVEDITVARSTGKLIATVSGIVGWYNTFGGHVFKKHFQLPCGVNTSSALEVGGHFGQTVDSYENSHQS